MKTIITDFDGTFADGNLVENIKLVQNFVAKGNQFIIATGRTFVSIKEAISKYNIPYDYLITSDGAAIYDSNDNIIYNQLMSNDLKYKIVDYILKCRYNLTILFDDNNFKTENISKVSRILVYGDVEKRRILCDDLNKEFDDIFAYLSSNCLDILYKQYTKLSAIEYLEREGKLGDIYTIGDHDNDFAMIKKYNGYLVGINSNYNTVSSFKKFIEKIYYEN